MRIWKWFALRTSPLIPAPLPSCHRTLNPSKRGTATMKNLAQLVEAAKKEGYERDPEHWCNKDDEWLEAKMKEAYREGAEGMEEAIQNMDISDPSLKAAMLNKISEQAKAFLSTLDA